MDEHAGAAGAAGVVAKYMTPAEITQMLCDDEAPFMQWIKVRHHSRPLSA